MRGMDRRDGVDEGCSWAVEGAGVRRVRAGGHGAVGGGHRGHLPLQELQDDVDVRRHPRLQSPWGEERDRELAEYTFRSNPRFPGALLLTQLVPSLHSSLSLFAFPPLLLSVTLFTD